MAPRRDRIRVSDPHGPVPAGRLLLIGGLSIFAGKKGIRAGGVPSERG
jgi:hypothetical protein